MLYTMILDVSFNENELLMPRSSFTLFLYGRDVDKTCVVTIIPYKFNIVTVYFLFRQQLFTRI